MILKKIPLLFLPGLLVLCFWLMPPAPAHAGEPVVLTDSQSRYPLGVYLGYLEDPTGGLGINDVTSPEHEAQFIYDKINIPIMGFTDSAYWVRVRLKNESHTQTSWRFVVPQPYFDAVDLYLPKANGEFEVKRAGDMRPFSVREVEHRQAVFKVAIPPQSERTLHLRIESTGFILFDLTLWATDAFNAHTARNQLLLGLFLGGLCIMMAYNLFLFIALGDRAYLYYVLFLLSSVMHLATLEHGLTYQFLWPNQMAFNRFATTFFPTIVMVFALLFAIEFLQTKTHAPALHRLMRALLLPYLAIAAACLLKQVNLVQQVLAFLTFPVIILLMIAGVIVWRRGYRPARYYVLALGLVGMNIITVILHVLGFLSRPVHVQMAPFATTGMILFLSLALADRINVLKQRTEQAKAETDDVNRQLNEHQQQLAVSEKKYRTIFEESNDMIFMTDMDGQVEDVSPACNAVLGYTRGEALKLNARQVYANPDDRAHFREHILKHGEVRDFEVKFRRKNGREFDGLVSGTLRRAEDGSAIGMQGIIRDITAHKQAEAERLRALGLQGEKELAEAANLAKSVFLSNMSHELRTPLHGLLGFAQRMKKDTALTPAQLQSVDIIYRNGEHLLVLLNDILDYTKIEANTLQLHPSRFALLSLLSQLADIARLKAKEKGLDFTFDAHQGLLHLVFGDQRRLRQILQNLLVNAVKFTQDGEVLFRVNVCGDGVGDLPTPKPPGPPGEVAESEEPRTMNVRFIVEDTGPGIASEQLEGIFQPFQQADPYKLKEGGAGLGLSVSHRLAMLMGSRINVESTVGEGTRFWFDLELPVDEFSPAQVSSDGASRETDTATEDTLRRAVAGLPAQYLGQLKQAAKRADFMALPDIIAQIRQQEPALADVLGPLVEDFRYDKILALIQQAEKGETA